MAYEENGKDAKSVDYARLVAVLIEAVKEQQKEIEALKARMEGMEKQKDHETTGPQDHKTTGQRPALSRVEGSAKAGE